MDSQKNEDWWAVQLREGFPGGRADGSVALSSDGCLVAVILAGVTAVTGARALQALTRSTVVDVVSTIVLMPVALVVFVNVVGRVEAKLHRK